MTLEFQKIANYFAKRNYLQYVAVFILFFSFLFILQFSFPNLICPDGYYHIKQAYLIRTQEFSAVTDFHWTKYSTLNDHSSDLWLGYHLLLMPFTFFKDLVFGAKLANVFFTTIFFAIFYFLLKHFKVKFPLFWISILTVINVGFMFRLLLPRGAIFSIVSTLLALYFIKERKYIALFFLSWFYAFSYPGFVILLILAILYALLEIIYKKQFNPRFFISILSGVILGLTIRPDFPNNLYMLFVQDFLAIFYKIKGIGLNFGAEFVANYSSFDKWEIVVFFLYLFFLFIAFRKLHKKISTTFSLVFYYLLIFFICLLSLIFSEAPILGKHLGLLGFFGLLVFWGLFPLIAFFIVLSKKKVLDNFFVFYLFLVCSLFYVLSLVAGRFIEYFVPILLFSLAVSIAPLIKLKEQFVSKIFWKKIFLVIIIAFCFPLSFLLQQPNTSSSYIDSFRETAPFLRSVLKENDVLFHISWSDFPGLFYYNDKNVYLAGMDPTFMYVKNVHLYWLWRNIPLGIVCDKEKCPNYLKVCKSDTPWEIYKTIKNNFPVNYIFIKDATTSDKNLVNILRADSGLFKEVPRENYFLKAKVFKIL